MIGAHVKAALGDRAVATYHATPVEGGLHLDLRNYRRTQDLIVQLAPSTVVLAAAEPWVERCELEPDATRALNVDAAGVVVEAAAAIDALVVVFSSEYVFDGRQGRYVEGDPVRPINEYGRQKVALETVARTARRHLICRTSGVYGWEPRRKNFVCQLLDHLRVGRQFPVPSDQMITPTYAVDLATTVSELIGRGITGTIHLVGPRILSRVAFAHSVCDVFELPATLIVPRPTGQLGLVAQRPLAAGLEDGRLRSLTGPLPEPIAALSHMRAHEPTPA